MQADGNAPLAFQVHAIQSLFPHLPFLKRPRSQEKLVRQG